MGYRCGKCGEKVPAGVQMLRVVKYRTMKISAESERVRREIESETPVCAECLQKHTEQELAEKFKNS